MSISSDQSTVLSNTQAWQQQITPQQNISGFYRQGSTQGKRIHFLHGTGFCAMTLAAIASRLNEEDNIWLTDVPGHGLSTHPNHHVPHWKKMAYNVADAISKQADVYNQGQLIGIGHSMGGVLTLFAAAKYPSLFSRIILLDPVLFKPEIIIAQRLLRATGAWRHSALVKAVSKRRTTWSNAQEMYDELKQKALYRKWQPEVLQDFITFATEQQQTANGNSQLSLRCQPSWEASIFGSYPKGLWQAIRKVNIPVDILVAENSYSFIPKAAKRAQQLNPNIRWQPFGENHCFPMEQPEQTANIIKSLLD